MSVTGRDNGIVLTATATKDLSGKPQPNPIGDEHFQSRLVMDSKSSQTLNKGSFLFNPFLSSLFPSLPLVASLVCLVLWTMLMVHTFRTFVVASVGV